MPLLVVIDGAVTHLPQALEEDLAAHHDHRLGPVHHHRLDRRKLQMADKHRPIADKRLGYGTVHLALKHGSDDVGQRDNGQDDRHHTRPEVAAHHQCQDEEGHNDGLADQTIVAQSTDGQLAHTLRQGLSARLIPLHIGAGDITDDNQV